MNNVRSALKIGVLIWISVFSSSVSATYVLESVEFDGAREFTKVTTTLRSNTRYLIDIHAIDEQNWRDFFWPNTVDGWTRSWAHDIQEYFSRFLAMNKSIRLGSVMVCPNNNNAECLSRKDFAALDTRQRPNFVGKTLYFKINDVIFPFAWTNNYGKAVVMISEY
ncbi:hypothetical protein CS022_12340 [Veronia nyctiphanis]|uniref:Uncharacterized protein n=1 Tax=Veronia nyctiphanis TaxID=1278244 RepID=A0A4Q0YPZ2_9GAMM|nr:hypothetical protein [Veronia nyctiphanis]RXJ73062.1 hypothetical protein CS022_12340 [Veronia nyctiphanis]